MQTLAFIGMPGHVELIVLLLIVLILFGKRLPTAMYSVGKSITEFKRGASEEGKDDNAEESEESSRTPEKQEN